MTAISTRPGVGRTTGPGWLLANVATVTGRNLHRLVRVPTLIAFATVQPVLFVLLFNYAWGGAIHPPGVQRYIDYALPGICRCPAPPCWLGAPPPTRFATFSCSP